MHKERHLRAFFKGVGRSRSRESRSAMIVSGNYLTLLGVRPAAGRFFPADEDSVPLASPARTIAT